MTYIFKNTPIAYRHFPKGKISFPIILPLGRNPKREGEYPIIDT
jgi:hypothetical protein